jgi:hypothetical protein
MSDPNLLVKSSLNPYLTTPLGLGYGYGVNPLVSNLGLA